MRYCVRSRRSDVVLGPTDEFLIRHRRRSSCNKTPRSVDTGEALAFVDGSEWCCGSCPAPAADKLFLAEASETVMWDARRATLVSGRVPQPSSEF